MSGVPIIGKIFEEVQKGLSHISKEIDKSDTIKAIIVVAAIYFTVGAATGAFSASGATGAATAGATSQSAMLASQTAAFGAEGAALTAEALASNAAAGAVVAGGASAAAPAAGSAPTASAAATGTTTGTAAGTAETAGAAGAEGGIGGWIEANPTQATILGQATLGAVQGSSAEDAENKRQQIRKEEEDRARDERLNRGLLGYDREGKYAGKAGIVGSNIQQPAQAGYNPTPQPMAQPTAQAGAAAAPIVASQQVAAVSPIAAPTVAVQRTDLPKLNLQR